MKAKALFIGALMTVSLHGAEDFNSEFSHFTGGAVLAGGVTALIDSYYPEYRSERGMIGFGVSAFAALVDQSIQYAEHGNGRGQILDGIAHIAGSALGAYLTDGYFLSPVMYESPKEGTFVGLTFRSSF